MTSNFNITFFCLPHNISVSKYFCSEVSCGFCIFPACLFRTHSNPPSSPRSGNESDQMSSQLPDYYYCSRIDLQCSLLIDRHSTQLQLALHYISTSCSHNSIPLYLNLHYSKDSIKDGFFKEGILNRVENCTFAEPRKIIKDTFKDICSA